MYWEARFKLHSGYWITNENNLAILHEDGCWEFPILDEYEKYNDRIMNEIFCFAAIWEHWAYIGEL